VRKRSGRPPLLNTPAEKSRPGLAGSLQLNHSTAVFPIPKPPIFPQPRLRSLQNYYRRLRFSHFHEHAAFLPLFLATEIKGSRKTNFTIFSLLTWRDSIGSLAATTNGNVDEGFQKVTQPIGSKVGVSSVNRKLPFYFLFLSFFYCSDLAFFWGHARIFTG
jgi:hypothetical protein